MPTSDAQLKTLWGSWADNLREKRAGSGIDQDVLASCAGVDRLRILKLEDGDDSPTDLERMAFAEAHSCRVEDLFPYPPSVTALLLESEPLNADGVEEAVSTEGKGRGSDDAGDDGIIDLRSHRSRKVPGPSLQDRQRHPSNGGGR